MHLDAGQFEGLVELLQIVDQQVRPGTIDRLQLADDSFLKIKPPLAPSKNFSHRRFAFERPINRVANRPMLQINLAVPAAGLEREASAALAQTAHLENFRSRKLIEISDERMAGVDTLGRRPGAFFKRSHKISQDSTETPMVLPVGDETDVLLLRHSCAFLRHAVRNQAGDFKRREMLPRVGRLLQSKCRRALHDKGVEIFADLDRDCLGKGARNMVFHYLYP